MLRHFVIFKFEEGFFTEEHLEEYEKAFAEIRDAYEEIYDVRIHKNCVDRPANMDLMIEMDLQDESALSAYLSHPEHIRMGQKYNPHVTSRVSFDYHC